MCWNGGAEEKPSHWELSDRPTINHVGMQTAGTTDPFIKQLGLLVCISETNRSLAAPGCMPKFPWEICWTHSCSLSVFIGLNVRRAHICDRKPKICLHLIAWATFSILDFKPSELKCPDSFLLLIATNSLIKILNWKISRLVSFSYYNDCINNALCTPEERLFNSLVVFLNVLVFQTAFIAKDTKLTSSSYGILPVWICLWW